MLYSHQIREIAEKVYSARGGSSVSTLDIENYIKYNCPYMTEITSSDVSDILREYYYIAGKNRSKPSTTESYGSNMWGTTDNNTNRDDYYGEDRFSGGYSTPSYDRTLVKSEYIESACTAYEECMGINSDKLTDDDSLYIVNLLNNQITSKQFLEFLNSEDAVNRIATKGLYYELHQIFAKKCEYRLPKNPTLFAPDLDLFVDLDILRKLNEIAISNGFHSDTLAKHVAAIEEEVMRAMQVGFIDMQLAKKPKAEIKAYKELISVEFSKCIFFSDKRALKETTGLHVGAVIFWLLAIGFEVATLLLLVGELNLNIMPTSYQIIITLVLDLTCALFGFLLWKKADHIKQTSKKEKKFCLQNNIGVIACTLAFIPSIIFVLTNKNTDRKAKVVATVVAIITLLFGSLISHEWNPVSAEQRQAAMSLIKDDVVWGPFAKVYHIDDDCHALNQTDTLTQGTVEQAFAQGRTRLCAYCAERNDTDCIYVD